MTSRRSARIVRGALTWFALVPLTAGAAAAQTPAASFVLSGEIRDSLTGEVVAGAVVRTGESSFVVEADGRFALALERFPVSLTIEAKGYRRRTDRVSAPMGPPGLIVLLDPSIRRDEIVEVNADRAGDPAPFSIPLRPQQVFQVAGAADNVFRAVQTLAGVAAPEEFSSRLSVRGGSPDQNLTVMDGVEIHNPYRLFGLTSAFNPETVERFELQTGAFEARYGDRLSSILTIRNRDGRTDRGSQGAAALSLTDGNVVWEGPWTEATRDKGSWIVTGRRTYYDLIADRIIDEDLPGFRDVQFRGAVQASPRLRATLFGLRSRESGDARIDGDDGDYGAFVTRSRNDLLGLSISSFFSDRLKTSGVVAIYDFTSNLNVDALFEDGGRRSNGRGSGVTPRISVDFEQRVTTRDLSIRNEWFYAASPGHLLEAGFEAHALRTSVAWDIRGDRNLTEANGSSVRGGAALPDLYDAPLDSSRAGFFVQDRMTMGGRLATEGGLRFDRSSLTKRVEVQPRISAVFQIDPTLRIRGAFGRHTQSPSFEKLVQADYFLDFAKLGLRNEGARHATLSVEKDVRGMELRVEAYRKTFSNLVVGALETDAELAARRATYDFPASLQDSVPSDPRITSRATNGASGRATGLEVVLTAPRRSRDQRLSGWASYSYGRATRTQYGRTFAFEYDRRHALQLSFQYDAGPKLDISFTLKASSGFPRAPAIGIAVVAVEDAADADGDSNRAELVPQRDPRGLPIYAGSYGGVSNLLSGRLPSFRRLDVRFNWRPRGYEGRWAFYIDVINATNRTNVARYEPDLRANTGSERPLLVEEEQRSIPFLPTFGIRFRF